jgi:hypothetical protein
LQPLLVEKFELTIEEAEDLIKFQQFSLRSLENQLNDVKNFDFTWGDLQSGLIPVKKDVKYRNLTDNNYGDVPTYSREVVWYGRKGSTMKNILVES